MAGSLVDRALVAVNAEDLKDVGDYVIKVLDGPHAGVRLVNKPGTLRIGSAGDNDVVLFASQAFEHHVEVAMPKGLFDPMLIKPVEGPVVLEDGSVVEVGQYLELEPGASFVLGDTTIEISRVAEPKSLIKPAARIAAVVALIAMLPLAWNIFSSMAVGVAGASSQLISSVGAQLADQRERYIGVTQTSEMKTAEAYAWTVRTKLEDLQLNFRVRANVTRDGSVRVAGQISDKELVRWTEFLRWYDGNASFPPLIRDVQRTTIDRNLPEVKSVWLDNEPTVFFKDGTTASVGTQIKDGWRVVAIDSSGVTIERDGAQVSLTY